MAKLPRPANTEGNKEGLDDFTPIPTGEYVASLTKSMWKETKDKKGHYLLCVWKVLQGEFKGKTLFDRLNLDNQNPVAVEIANKTLNSMCQACGKFGVNDSDELKDIPILLSVVMTKGDANNPPGNDIKGFKKIAPQTPVDKPLPVDNTATDGGGQPSDSTPDKGEDVPVNTPTNTEKLPWE